MIAHILVIIAAMSAKPQRKPVRRRPQQRRARETVAAILDAAVRLMKREGLGSLTTNRIAEVAGVSIGSVYQYFPDKSSIFIVLHQRHVDEIDRLIAATLIEHAASPLDTFIRAVMDAMIDAHTTDPELYELLQHEVPHRADGAQDFSVRLHGAFRLALSSRASELGRVHDLDKAAFIVTHMVDSLAHGAVLRRPRGLSLRAAKEEAVRAVLAYLHA